VTPSDVIGETLQRATPQENPDDPQFLAALRARVEDHRAISPASYSAFVVDPLSSWIEGTFGVFHDSASQRIRRRRPRCLTGKDGAASELGRTTGTSEERAKQAIEEALLAGYTCERNPATGFPAFAFRLHQFISRGDTIYASLESEDQRYLTLNRQQFVPGDRTKVLLPLVFCRECGQEYYCVRRVEDSDSGAVTYVPRELSDRSNDGDSRAGFLYYSAENPWPSGTEQELSKLPEDPVFDWTPEQRKRDGFPFLRDEVFKRRIAMLGIADQIRALNESLLNEGKVRVEQTFSGLRQRLTVTLGLTIGLGMLLAAFSIWRILGLESDSSTHLREILQLSARLVAAQEDERRSISRELHDEVGQSLTGVLVEMANLSTSIRAGDVAAVAAKADEVKKLVKSSIGVVRNMALLLRPSMLDDLGLVPALEWQAREVSKRSGVWVKVLAENVAQQLPDEHKTCVYRVVQEALHNCVQHAGTCNVTVTVKQEPERLLLTVRDDGRGFDPSRGKGMGLLGIEERVSHLGGAFAVESLPGNGALLHVSLPLEAQ
jgi:signal transduction histidine kinase